MRSLILVWLALLSNASQAAPPHAGQLLREIDRLQVVGSVLYVAAHPDDENTRLLSWLVGERGLQATYLSMTRGGGGQNLIGSEQAELLGVLRTEELLAARRIDGAQQLFTRMRDFGYSKSTEETLERWGRASALTDVVRAIRQVRPDIVVTRFAPDWGGHGHHTASAELAAEAFAKAADPSFATPGLPPWQATRLLHNTSTWRRGPDFVVPDDWMQIDAGSYDALSGRSWGEVAAASRTMHKSQGFGSAPRVGPSLEYFTLTAGAPSRDPFGGIDTSWSRMPGTQRLQRHLARASTGFNPRAPHRALPHLARAHAELTALPEAAEPWRTLKLHELERVMLRCAGVWLTATADQAAVAPGTEASVSLTALARAPISWTLHDVSWNTGHLAGPGSLTTEKWSETASVPVGEHISRLHWLADVPSPTQYNIRSPTLHNTPATPATVKVTFELTIANTRLAVEVPVRFSRTDPVRGEVHRDLEVLPPITVTPKVAHLMLPRGQEEHIELTLRAFTGPASGTITFSVPEGFTVEPATLPVTFAEGEVEKTAELRVTADPKAAPGVLRATHEAASMLSYAHIPERTVLRPVDVNLVPLSLSRGNVARVGYLQGSGDRVAEGLRSVGYAVEEIDETAIRDSLDRFDAVVLGIRAYNTRPGLPALHDALMAYVERGGTLIVQYNTSRRWGPLASAIGPEALDVGRGRVTDETATPDFLEPEHPVMRHPNRITSADFDGWVQERGLYFVESWHESYTPIFAFSDPGEEPQSGALLVAEHGKGRFIYTSLSFFRQLPAGVPGAYRLFANLLALGET